MHVSVLANFSMESSVIHCTVVAVLWATFIVGYSAAECGYEVSRADGIELHPSNNYFSSRISKNVSGCGLRLTRGKWLVLWLSSLFLYSSIELSQTQGRLLEHPLGPSFP